MAIQSNVILSNGVELKNSYIVIDIEKSKILFRGGCKINVYIFVNEEYRIKNIPAANGTVLIESSSDDFIGYFSESVLIQNNTTDTRQAYEYIKFKDGELEQFLGFNVDWENIQNI